MFQSNYYRNYQSIPSINQVSCIPSVNQLPSIIQNQNQNQNIPQQQPQNDNISYDYNRYYDYYNYNHYNNGNNNLYTTNTANYNLPPIQNHLPQPKELEITGGVSAILDYDLNTMSNFITWIASNLFKSNLNFENKVKNVLTATRLPKSTIILAINYLNEKFSNINCRNLSIDDIFNKVIISLILGNKFNDDNTFSNKSWSGATGIDLQTINKQEREWLFDINWSLNSANFENNLSVLLKLWDTWNIKFESIPQQQQQQQQQPQCRTPIIQSSSNNYSYNNTTNNYNNNNPQSCYLSPPNSSPIMYESPYKKNWNYNSSEKLPVPVVLPQVNQAQQVTPISYNYNIWSSNYYNYGNYYGNGFNSYYNLQAC